MIGWKEIGRSHMEKNKTNRWCDYGQETQFKVLEPVNTITQRHESHKKGILRVYQSKHWKQGELPLLEPRWNITE